MRELIASEQEKRPVTTWPFLSCLSEDSFSAFRIAAWKNHHKRLTPVEPENKIMDFDAEKEMSKIPHQSAEARR
jgi:hypothetical protein